MNSRANLRIQAAFGGLLFAGALACTQLQDPKVQTVIAALEPTAKQIACALESGLDPKDASALCGISDAAIPALVSILEADRKGQAKRAARLAGDGGK